MIRVEVEDTGIGIDPAKKAAIFEPFAQADESITRVYGGTGLGTSIARQLINLMGGQIGVDSRPDVGSLFWFEVPLQQCDPQGIDLSDELAAATRLSASTVEVRAGVAATVHRMRGARILVAEDNPTNQRVTELILESGGHVPTIVNDGEAALDALEQGGFHLALFDMSMPGVSGLEALKLYRFSTQKPIPIIVLSANVTKETIAQCQAAGAAEFVAKPVRPSILLDAIERHLSSDLIPALTMPPPRSEERPSLAIVDTPLLDRTILSDLSKLSSDPTFVDRLIVGFKSDCNRLMNDLTGALAARRYEAAKDAAHALKGGAGGVGASQLLQFAIRIEKATHETLRLKAAQWTDELQRLSTRTQAALDEHISERHQNHPQSLQ
jgi:two-component system sensor histidine kinase RpfC